MKTLDLITNLTLFILFIGQIQSLTNSETVYDNVIVLDSVSNWKFRQAKDEIPKANEEKYFLIEEDNNLNLSFKENINIEERFKDLNECTKVDIKYSFDYYLDLNAKIKKLSWNFNLLKRNQEIKADLKKWIKVSNKAVINFEDLETDYEKDEIFEMFISTVDKYENDKYKTISDIRFAIKNLKLILSCKENSKIELEFKLNSDKNYQNPFTVSRNDKLLENIELIDYWSNLIYPQFENDRIDKYYYSEKIFDHLNFMITEKDFRVEEELCLSFDYFITKSAFLTISFKNSINGNTTLLKLYTSEIDECLINNKIKKEKFKLQWNKATLCLNGEEMSQDNLPQWTIETFIFKSELKTDIVAVTNFQAKRKLQQNIKNYIPNWKLNGKESSKDWTLIPQTKNFKLDITNKNELKLNLREIPSPTKRHYYLISDWFLINTIIKFLTFKVNSNLTDYHLTLKVLLDIPIRKVYHTLNEADYKTWNLNENFDDKILQFSFHNVLELIRRLDKLNYGELKGEGKARILIEIYNNRLINPTIDELKKESEKDYIEQLLTISEVQLADECTDELICNSHGSCVAFEANKAYCKCDEGYHGDNCEYRNSCIQKNVQLDNSMTGNEFCKTKTKTECVPEFDEFSCRCKFNEYWNYDSLQCVAISDCLFTPCGVNEECKLKGPHNTPTCECKEKHILKDGLCQKDLCLIKPKFCPNNMICMHLEGKANPECGCPLGMAKKGNECVDLSDGENPYSGVNPFVLQKTGCSQYYTLENGEAICECLPGYKIIDDKCEATFDLESSCSCNDKQICIKNEKKNKSPTYECVCKPGFFGENCGENICERNRAQNFCGEDSCEITDNGQFVCKCDKNLYKINDFGLCDWKDTCTEDVTCDKNAVCVNQVVKSSSKWTVKPHCGCRRGLISSDKGLEKCVDGCVTDPKKCSSKPFTECKYMHTDEEFKCNCQPGFWRKNSPDSCTPVKNSLLMSAIYTPLNTDQNPIREQDKYPELLDEEYDGGNFLISNQINFTIPKYMKSKFKKLSAIKKKEVVSHISISSIAYPCLSYRLDLEGCIDIWNSAFEKINKIPEEPELNKGYLESVLRSTLLETFNHKRVFNKKIESIKILNFNALTDLVHQHFGLKTFYQVKFLIQSNLIDLTPKLIQQTLKDKCRKKIGAKDGKESLCSIEELGLFTLSNVDLEEYDLCERNVLTCHEWNFCYSNRKEEKDWDFEKNKVAYECRCKSGFKSIKKNELGPFLSFYNHTCADINECESAELNNCDPISTKCVNTIGSFKCECITGYKPANETHCIELCSKIACEHGTCKKIGDHEDICRCSKGWAGPACNLKNNLSNYKNALIIVIIVAAIVLVLTVVGLLIYSRNYSSKMVEESTAALKRELEMVRLRSNNNEVRITETSGQDNPSFTK